MSGGGLLKGLWASSTSAAVLILAVLLLRTLFRSRMPRQVFCLLWDMALARLLILAALPSPVSIWRWLPASSPTLTPEVSHIVTPGLAASADQVVTEGGAVIPDMATSWQALLPDRDVIFMAVWLAGALALAAWFLYSHLRSCRVYAVSLPLEDTFVRDWLASHLLWRRIRVRTSDRIAAPLTWGILRPVVLLPSGMERTDRAALSCVLEHEYQHIRRFDTLRKALLAAAVCLHWFNPLAWVLYVMCNRDLELACDEAVTEQGMDRAKYALTLLSMEEQRSEWGLSGSHFSQNALEERIRCIMKHKKTSIPALAAVLAVTGFATTVLASAAPSGNVKISSGQERNAKASAAQEGNAESSSGQDAPTAGYALNIEDDIGCSLDPYRAFGLSYKFEWNQDGESQLRMSWNGKPVHSLWDTETKTWFANNMHGSEYGGDALDLETIYQDGKLCGLQESRIPHGTAHSNGIQQTTAQGNGGEGGNDL